MFQKFDLWLRGVWAFWDTHGTRLLGVVSSVYGFATAVFIAFASPDSKIAAALVTVSGALGLATKARGTTNAQRAP